MKNIKSKRGIVLLLCLALTASMMLIGCSSGGSSSSDSSGGQPSDSQSAQDATKSESTANDSKFAVTIDDCMATTDYKGEPAIIVTYTFTNNSDKATSFMVAITDKCFQGGVELSTAITTGEIDAQASMNDIKPGATITVQKAYSLRDQSEVTVECSELFSLSDTLIAEKTFNVA